MNSNNFDKFMENLDLHFARQDIPFHERPWNSVYYLKYKSSFFNKSEILKKFNLRESQYEQYLMNKSTEWYQEKYGDRIKYCGYLEKIPTYIRNQLYFFKIPLVFGCVPDINVFDYIEGLNLKLRSRLKKDEIKHQIEAFTMVYDSSNLFEELIRVAKIRGGTNLKRKIDFTLILEEGEKEFLNKVHELEKNDYTTELVLNENEKELLKSAYADRQDALRSYEDYNYSNSSFHSQQHVEKIMKIILLKENICSYDKLSSYSHNLVKVLEELQGNETFPDNLENSIQFLNSYSMKYRYNSKGLNDSFALRMLLESILVVNEFCKILLKREGFRKAVYKDNRLHFIDSRYLKMYDKKNI